MWEVLQATSTLWYSTAQIDQYVWNGKFNDIKNIYSNNKNTL